MSKISKLKRLEEALARKNRLKQIEADQKLHQQMIEKHAAAHTGWKKPISRRDFLEVGVLSMSSYLLGPSLLTILGSLSEEARAAVVGCPVNVPTSVPFINLHLSGGIQTLSIATPRMTNGARLGTYTRLGLGDQPTFVNNVFANGAELFDAGVANSGFLRGLQNGATAATLKNSAFVTVPIRDNGDSEQPFSILGMVERSGRTGEKLGFLRSGGNVKTGINGSGAFNIATSTSPISINALDGVTNSIRWAGALGRLTVPQQKKLASTIQGLNDAQAASITGVNGGAELAKLVQCATDKNISNLDGVGASTDPNQVAGLSAVWNAFAQTGGGGNGGTFNNAAIASIVTNVLNGNSGGGAINIGGFDIHADIGSRAQQEVGAFNIGQAVGRMLQTASLMNKKIFVHITTNGAVVNAGGGLGDQFNNDDNNGNCFGASHFIMYDPSAPVTTVSALPAQIGGLTAQGNSDRSVFTSTVDNGEAAAFYNYCIFSGMGDPVFDRVTNGFRAFSGAEKAIMRKKA